MRQAFSKFFPVLGLVALLVAGCETTGGGSSTSTASNDIDGDEIGNYSVTNEVDGATRRVPGGLEVNTFAYDESTAPRACVNNLRVYEAFLQAPETPAKDLDKTVPQYIREAGGAAAAIGVANLELLQLQADLQAALENRNPFDLEARARADDRIAQIEDGILLNEALIEALNCHL